MVLFSPSFLMSGLLIRSVAEEDVRLVDRLIILRRITLFLDCAHCTVFCKLENATLLKLVT
jgi:hypothetical protein